MRQLRPPPRVVIGNERQHPPPRLFEPVADHSRSYPHQEASYVSTSVNDFDDDVKEQMRLLEESVRATLQLPADSINIQGTSYPISARERVIYDSAPIQATTFYDKDERIPQVAQPFINLKDWKKLGYPSEYAYAKDSGLLNEKPKPPVAANSSITVNQNSNNKQLNQISYAQQLQQQVDERRLQREKEAKDSRIAPSTHSSSSVASIGSIRDDGRSNRNDTSNTFSSAAPTYQRTIEGPYNPTSMQKITVPTSKESLISFQNEKNGFHSGRKDSNNNIQQISGLALGLDVTTEKELKRKKQQEYKQQLDMINKDKVAVRDQQSPRAFPGARQDPQVSLNIYTGGNGTPQRKDSSNTPYIDQATSYNTAYQGQERRQTQNAAPYNGGDKTSRRLKQEEYKRELDRQMYEKTTKISNDAESRAQYNVSTDPHNKEASRNVQRQQDSIMSPSYNQGPVRPTPYENVHGGQQYYSHDAHYPSQSDMDNDPHFQAYLRRKNEENPQHFQREMIDYPNDYGEKSRINQPPLYRNAVSDQPPTSSAMLSPGQQSRMKLVTEVYGYGSNPLLGDGASANNNNNNSRRTGQQKSTANNQKALLDQQVNEVRERKRLEKLKIEEEDQKREKRLQDEIAAEEDKKRKDKQLQAEQAKREMIEMQDKASKDALNRKGKTAASSATTNSTNASSSIISEEPSRTQYEDRKAYQRGFNDQHPSNSGYHESREVYEPANDSDPYLNSYAQPQQPSRPVYPNPGHSDLSQIDIDNDPHFQAYLRRKAAENQYHQESHEGYEQRRQAVKIAAPPHDRELSSSSPSKPSPKQSSRMKLFSEVYGYGSNPLVAGTGNNGAADNDWKPSGGNSKQKVSANAQKAFLDEQLHAVRERKRLEQLKIEEEDKRREKRAQDELAAEEEKKRQEIEKKKLLADKERQDISALQDKIAKEALARKGKAATAGDLQHQQSDDQPSEDNRRSNHGQFDHISSPLKDALEGSRRPQQPYRDHPHAQSIDEEDFRGIDRRQRPQPPQQQSRDYYYDDGNRSVNYDNYGNGYPDAPHASTNDSLSYSNAYASYPPKPNYHPSHASAPYHERQNHYGYNGGPQYDPRHDGYPPYQNRNRPNNHVYPGHDNSGYSDFDSSQISDRSANNYPPSNYHNGNPQSGQHFAQQRSRNYQQQQPPPHNHRSGASYAPSEYADVDDKDLSFVSESRLLPSNPWSSSDMLSNLIPLGSKLESQRAANKNRNELEQSLASNSLLLYLGNRTPLVEPTSDNTISAGNSRARSASTPKRMSSAAKLVPSTPKYDNGNASDERLKRLIEDTNIVIDKELNATNAAAGLQRQPKDSMKSLLGYQQDVVDRPRGNATPDGRPSDRRTGTAERPSTTGFSSNVIQRSGVNAIISDTSDYRMQQQQQQQRAGSRGGGGARTPVSRTSNHDSDSNPWDVPAEAKEAMRRQLSSTKNPISSPLSLKMRASDEDPEEASYLNDSFS